jgi:hypothetical protein
MLRNRLDPLEAARKALGPDGVPRREIRPRRRTRPATEPRALKATTRSALSLLLRELLDGPRRSSEIDALARAEGVGPKAMKTARRLVCEPAGRHGEVGPGQFWTLRLKTPLPSWLARRGVTR